MMIDPKLAEEIRQETFRKEAERAQEQAQKMPMVPYRPPPTCLPPTLPRYINPRCPTCGCFVSPMQPVDYCRRCETSAAVERERAVRAIRTAEQMNGYRRVIRHLRTKKGLPW